MTTEAPLSVKEVWMGATDAEVIGAIRLAMEAGSDSESQIKLIYTLLEYAEPTEPSDTRSTRLLLDTIQALGGSVTVPE